MCTLGHTRRLALFVSPWTAGCPVHSCWRGWVQAESLRGKKTIHIKGVPLVEHDYQPLSPESTSPPSTPSITHIGWEVRGDLLNTSWPQTDITHVFLFSSDYFSLFCNSWKTFTINRQTQTDSRSLTTISSYLYYLCITDKFMLYFQWLEALFWWGLDDVQRGTHWSQTNCSIQSFCHREYTTYIEFPADRWEKSAVNDNFEISYFDKIKISLGCKWFKFSFWTIDVKKILPKTSQDAEEFMNMMMTLR